MDGSDKILTYSKSAEGQEGFTCFSSFHKLIVYLKFEKTIGFTIEVIDFKNDPNIAFEDFCLKRDKEWPLEARQSINKVFNEITADKSEPTELVRIFEIPYK